MNILSTSDLFLSLFSERNVNDIAVEIVSHYDLVPDNQDLESLYALISESDLANEGRPHEFTLTANSAVTEGSDVIFSVIPEAASAASQGTNSTNLNDLVSGTFDSEVVTISAESTTVTFSVVGLDDGLTGLPELYSVQALVADQTIR